MNPLTRPPWRRLTFVCLLLCTWVGASVAQTLSVPIPGKQSILRVGAIPDPVSGKGRAVAQLIMDGLEKKDELMALAAQLAAQIGWVN